MISTQISRASAALLLVGGLALLFASDVILPRLIPAFPPAASWIGQLLGAGWLALAALNWLSRSTLLGGIYGRPLLLANLSLYFISAMVLLKVVIAGDVSAGVWFVAVAVAVFAGVYAVLLFRGPTQRDFEMHRAPRSATLPLIIACALAFGGIISCQDLTDPLPDGSEPLQPPPVFHQWWSQTQSCSGRTGSISDVRWYIVRDEDWSSYWQSAGNRIVLAEHSWLDGDVVRHEMLHALLAVNRLGHPREQFLGRCGGVVRCGSDCRDAGPMPPIAVAETVTPDALELSIEVTPTIPGTPPYSGHFSVIVRVRNPANHAVGLQLGPSAQWSSTFKLRLLAELSSRSFIGTIQLSDAADTVFTAGQTKQHIFDFAIGTPQPYERHSPDHILFPGTYSIEFGYGSRWGTMENNILTVTR